jgi:hypothetical protein
MSEATELEQGGTGNGMGLMVNARPIGVIKITGDKVDWVPTVDVGMLATIGALVAGVLAILFMVGRNKKLSAKVTHATSAPAAAGLVGLASEAVHLIGKIRSKATAA